MLYVSAYFSIVWHTALVRKSMLLLSSPSMFHDRTRIRCGSGSTVVDSAFLLSSELKDVASSDEVDAK